MQDIRHLKLALFSIRKDFLAHNDHVMSTIELSAVTFSKIISHFTTQTTILRVNLASLRSDAVAISTVGNAYIVQVKQLIQKEDANMKWRLEQMAGVCEKIFDLQTELQRERAAVDAARREQLLFETDSGSRGESNSEGIGTGLLR